MGRQSTSKKPKPKRRSSTTRRASTSGPAINDVNTGEADQGEQDLEESRNDEATVLAITDRAEEPVEQTNYNEPNVFTVVKKAERPIAQSKKNEPNASKARRGKPNIEERRGNGQALGELRSPQADEIRLTTPAPKNTDGCRGACSSSYGFGLDHFAEMRQALDDIADYLVDPIRAGPWLKASTGNAQSPEEAARVDRLWELRLCIEMLRDALDANVTYGNGDHLSTAEERLDAIDELLCRIAALGFAQTTRAYNGGIENGTATFNESECATVLMQVVGSKDFQRGRLAHCLLESKLGISGLLQAVLGELTDWKCRPGAAELKMWQHWDIMYEVLLRKAKRTAACDNYNEVDPTMPIPLCPAPKRFVECFDARSLRCAGSLFGGKEG